MTMDREIIDILKDNLYVRFLEELQKADWNVLTRKYENFLSRIPLSDYRERLQKIKTVEFDLSGKYRSFHLSLIYHLYWKEKYITTNDCNVSGLYRKIKEVCNFLNNHGGRIPLYKILGNFGFNTEKKFMQWLYLKEYSNNIFPSNFIDIEQHVLSNNVDFPSFKEFWSEYKNNVSLDDFINQHANFIDMDSIKSQITQEIDENNTIFNILQEEDIETEKAEELIKGYILVGLKARMYRTWVSLLTQLDLGYIWNKTIQQDKLDSDVVLDTKGIDLYGKINDSFVGIQIKKRSRRHEALKVTDSVAPIRTIDIPYDLNFENDEYLSNKLTKLANGFVIFNKNYVEDIYTLITQENTN